MSGNEQQEQQQPSSFMQTSQQQQISLPSNQQRQQQHAANQQQQVLMQQQQQYHQFQQLQQQQQQNQYMQQQQQQFEPPTPRQPLFRVVHGSSSTSSTRVQGRPYNVRQQTAESPPLRPGLSEQQQQQPRAPMQQYPPPGYFNVVQNGRSFMIRPVTNFRPAFSLPQQQSFRPGFPEQQQQNFRPAFSEQQQQNFRPAFSEQQQQNFRPAFSEQQQQNFRPGFSQPQQQQLQSGQMQPRFYQFGTQTPPPTSNVLYSTAQERHSTPLLSQRPRAAMSQQHPSAPSQNQAYFHQNQRYPLQPQNLCSPEQAFLPPFQPPRQTIALPQQQQQQLASPLSDAAALAPDENSLQIPTVERRLSETSDCEVIDERKERYVELAYYQLNIEQIGTVRIAEVDYTSLPPEIAAEKDRLEHELEDDGENDERENEPGNESDFESSAKRTKLS